MSARFKELLVPLLMVAGVAAYLIDTRALSAIGFAFPRALILVIVVSLALIIYQAMTVSLSALAAERRDGDVTGTPSRVDAFRPWLLVLIPLPLIVFWRQTGALPALAVMIVSLMVVLGERRLLWLVLVPMGLALPLYYLFKAILYVRLPALPGIGF